jgi:hypothetical protein
MKRLGKINWNSWICCFLSLLGIGGSHSRRVMRGITRQWNNSCLNLPFLDFIYISDKKTMNYAKEYTWKRRSMCMLPDD